ncbi:MAG: hypothetical protein P8J27_12825 [Mariniblastus sp.]|nr:hypothetical protein [Mariniblastus sp.]
MDFTPPDLVMLPWVIHRVDDAACASTDILAAFSMQEELGLAPVDSSLGHLI